MSAPLEKLLKVLCSCSVSRDTVLPENSNLKMFPALPGTWNHADSRDSFSSVGWCHVSWLFHHLICESRQAWRQWIASVTGSHALENSAVDFSVHYRSFPDRSSMTGRYGHSFCIHGWDCVRIPAPKHPQLSPSGHWQLFTICKRLHSCL